MHCDINSFQEYLDAGVSFDLVGTEGVILVEVSAKEGYDAEKAFAEAALYPGAEWISRD